MLTVINDGNLYGQKKSHIGALLLAALFEHFTGGPSSISQFRAGINFKISSTCWCCFRSVESKPSSTKLIKSTHTTGETKMDLRSQSTHGERLGFIKSNIVTSCIESSVLWHHSPSLMSLKKTSERDQYGLISCYRGQVKIKAESLMQKKKKLRVDYDIWCCTCPLL